MTCYHPFPAYQIRIKNKNGKFPVVFDSRIAHQYPSSYVDLIYVPCGRCVGCRLSRCRQWAIRCVHEANLHEKNSFITLTFNDAHLAEDGSLHDEDFVKFMKRLRKKIAPLKIRFFHCGEYGSLHNRPHHHAIIFGYDFPDRQLFNISNGISVYTSLELDNLWRDPVSGESLGFATVGDVTFDSAAYVARYVLKKVGGDAAAEHYQGRKPEYVTMSRRPGIAHDWIVNNFADVYNYDHIVIPEKFDNVKPPKYYDKIFDIYAHESMEIIKAKRKEELSSRPVEPGIRLLQKEKFKLRSLERFKRRYEQNEPL